MVSHFYNLFRRRAYTILSEQCQQGKNLEGAVCAQNTNQECGSMYAENFKHILDESRSTIHISSSAQIYKSVVTSCGSTTSPAAPCVLMHDHTQRQDHLMRPEAWQVQPGSQFEAHASDPLASRVVAPFVPAEGDPDANNLTESACSLQRCKIHLGHHSNASRRCNRCDEQCRLD